MAKAKIFTGSGVAIITPFTETGINYEKLGELIDFQIEQGTDAIVVCGTTGEASTMPDSEHLEAIKYTVEKVNKRVPVIAGTGSNDTKHAVGLSQEAQESGADAILSVTPYYNKTTQRGLCEHFRVIAESVDIPVILYNVPSRTNLNIDPATVEKLARIKNINALKECNLMQVPEILKRCGEDINIYSGEDGQVYFYLALGGLGVISVMANIAPKYTHDMVMKYHTGDIKGSLRMQISCLDLIKALFCEVSPIPVKEAMNIMGMEVGECRLPLYKMAESNIELLKKELTAFGCI
ncbi:MAG: 4-hydroxy-tetrahydrodipicolinate synthase [Clostridiales bacterium]|nr:4-hydroxy-tetrahydrodipicolinate synthase [Clostridiales bacterium]